MMILVLAMHDLLQADRSLELEVARTLLNLRALPAAVNFLLLLTFLHSRNKIT